MKKAVCLISGGIDSFLTAEIAKRRGYKIYCLTVDYGQKARKEIEFAKKIVKYLNAEEHIILKIDLSFLKSALTRKEVKIPEKKVQGIPSTYVPARNTIFISLALGYAETIGADAIFIGVNSVDFSGYPDCRPIYIKKFQKLIDKAISHNLDLSITWSCYKNGKKPCGKCPSCRIREKAISDILENKKLREKIKKM
jgi:7-cyano-7-deazaguanine synthase